MGKFFLIILVAIGLGLLIFNNTAASKKEICIQGNKIEIRTSEHFIAGTLGSEGKYQFLVNNATFSKSKIGSLAVIPMGRVRELERIYPDFIHCGSPGETAGKNSIHTIILITADSGVEKEIKAVAKKGLSSPVIEIDGSTIEIKEHTYKGIKYPQFEREEYLLVNSVKITSFYPTQTKHNNKNRK